MLVTTFFTLKTRLGPGRWTPGSDRGIVRDDPTAEMVRHAR